MPTTLPVRPQLPAVVEAAACRMDQIAARVASARRGEPLPLYEVLLLRAEAWWINRRMGFELRRRIAKRRRLDRIVRRAAALYELAERLMTELEE